MRGRNRHPLSENADDRFWEGGTYGNANRVLTFDNCSYTTDAEGNVTSRTGASCATPLSGIAWTPLGQLDSLIQGGNKVKFFYDALGRLVAKRLNGTLQSYFLWDGDNLLAELNNTASAVVTEYSYYGPDVLHAVIKQPGKLKYFARVDGLGNVLALTDTTSAIKRDYGWDDWGKQTSGTDNASFNGTDRARWKGALWMGSEVDLYYMRNRWYEPATGRFLSEDPIGLEGGINNVTYGGNDPVNGKDPSGTVACYDVYEMTYSISGGHLYVKSVRFLYDYCTGYAKDGPNLGPARGGGGGGGWAVLARVKSDPCDAYKNGTRPGAFVGTVCENVNGPDSPSDNQCTASLLSDLWTQQEKAMGRPHTWREAIVEYLVRDHPPTYKTCGYNVPKFAVALTTMAGARNGRQWPSLFMCGKFGQLDYCRP